MYKCEACNWWHMDIDARIACKVKHARNKLFRDAEDWHNRKEAEKAKKAHPATPVVSSPRILEEVVPSRLIPTPVVSSPRILEEVAPSRCIPALPVVSSPRILEEVVPSRLIPALPVVSSPRVVEPPPPYVPPPPQPSETVKRQPIPSHFREDLVHMSSILQWTCVVCMERMDEERVNLTPCFHKVCTWCESQLKDARCPVCREKIFRD